MPAWLASLKGPDFSRLRWFAVVSLVAPVVPASLGIPMSAMAQFSASQTRAQVERRGAHPNRAGAFGQADGARPCGGWPNLDATRRQSE